MIEIKTLSGKTAVIAGASRGIGRAIALKLARAGADLALIYYNSHEEAEVVRGEAEGLGRKARIYQADVSDPESMKEAFEQIEADFSRIDIAVCNAAVGVLRPAMSMTLKHWRRCMETNAFAFNMLTQLSVPLMKTGGRILALSSLGAERAIPDYAFIGASKAALESLARSLAQELGPLGIRVNIVNAGVVDTDALKHFPRREELLEESAKRTPAGTPLTPEEVADALYLLCLPEAEKITGHTLYVDGGYRISG